MSSYSTGQRVLCIDGKTDFMLHLGNPHTDPDPATRREHRSACALGADLAGETRKGEMSDSERVNSSTKSPSADGFTRSVRSASARAIKLRE